MEMHILFTWNILLFFNVFQATVAISAIQCNGWTLKEPKNGLLKCNQAGVLAIPGTTTCEIICSANYGASEEILYCPKDGAWAPTTKPECIADGNLTTIVVPAVLGSLFLFIFVVFVCTRLSNVCDKKTRGHESVDESYVEVGRYTLPRRKQTDTPPSYKERVPDKFHEEKPSKKKNSLTDTEKIESVKDTSESDSEFIEDFVTYSPKKKKSRFTIRKKKRTKNVATKKVKTPYRKRIKLGFTACFRRVHSWRSSSGPKRIVGKPGKIGVSSICGDMDRFQSTSSYPYSSSESEYTDTDDSQCEKRDKKESPYISGDQNPSLDIKITDEKIVQTGSHTNNVNHKKIPPARPPQPLLSKIKQNSKATKSKKRQSSGYSSEENDRKKKGMSSKNNKKEIRERKSKSPEKSTKNPYQHYPVTGSDRQYMDFEHDYRKNGHIYEEGVYHPQYHPVESFPIKPVKKDKPSDEKRHTKKKSSNKKEPDENTTTGGVKYYSITPDEEEFKKKKSRRKRSKSLDREGRKRKGEIERKRDLSPKERRGREKSKKRENTRKVTKTKKSSRRNGEDKVGKTRRTKLEKHKESREKSP